jgi:hypothetical protein
MRSLYRLQIRELGLSLAVGVVAIVALVIGLSMFFEPPARKVQLADNGVRITAPVTDDTPGPVMTDSGVPNREIPPSSPLADRDR